MKEHLLQDRFLEHRWVVAIHLGGSGERAQVGSGAGLGAGVWRGFRWEVSGLGSGEGLGMEWSGEGLGNDWDRFRCRVSE